jgi:fructokinase
MEKKYDVIALGELLIDFTENGISGQGNPLFEANPGGAPCNVLAMLTRLGKKTGFIGKVGNDSFGRMLRERVAGLGIDVTGLVTDEEVPTTLAFVHTAADGERSFSFYRNPGADVCLTPAEVDMDQIRQTRIFHFGSLSMTAEPALAATRAALNAAKKSDALISFDPNYRPLLWESEAFAREAIAYGLKYCHILKISDDEIELMTGCSDVEAGVAKLRAEYPIPLIFATMGKRGSLAFYQDLVVEGKPYLNEKTIETTGAGDAFCACALAGVLEVGLGGLDCAKLEEILSFANAAASLITTKRGALCVMPEWREVEAFMERRKQ